jgi:adenosylcobinamide-phosphate synthase
MEILLAVVLGFLLDLLLGDPHWLPHPVRLMGLLISGGERLLRRIFPKTSRGELATGTVLAVLVPAFSFAVPLLLLWLAGMAGWWLRLLLATVFCYQALAAKCLRVESMRVYQALRGGGLPEAQKALSWIVGRDTDSLSEEKVIKAAVETVAENASDGEIAPLFYLMIGGAPLGFLYKAVNTMDSMIGYKNEKYLYFGRAAARMDDVLNFIPALLSAWFMTAASFLLGLDGRGPGASTAGTAGTTPAPTAPGSNRSAPGRWGCSWPGTLIISASW